LQNTDVISNPENLESEVVAGPYHEAFGQLVDANIWYDKIVEEIKKINVKVKEIEILVNPENVNSVIGHKKENLEKLKKLYDLETKINKNEEIRVGAIKVIPLKTFKEFLDD